jgi:hypothetical protein
MRYLLGIALVAAVVLFTGFDMSCGVDPDDDTYKHLRDEELTLNRLKHTEREIMEMIGDAGCDGVESCRCIAFGDKPCGGPWKYLIYSIANVDTIALREKVSEYNILNAEANRDFGWRSDCMFVERPVLMCKEGACTEVPRD